MNLSQLLVPKQIKTFPTICDLFVVTLIFFQYYNNSVNCSRFQAQGDLTSPEIIPKGEDYIINATQTFTLRCSGKNFVTWTAPDNVDYSSEEPLSKYSNITIKSSNTLDSEYPYKSVLTISNASYLDVGYYYCHENTTDFNDSSRVSRIYLYVYDDKVLSLNPEAVLYAITVFEHSDALLPCKPASPDVKVELREVTGDENNLEADNNFPMGVQRTPVLRRSCAFQMRMQDLKLYRVKTTSHTVSSVSTTDAPNSIAKPLLEEISDGHTIVGQKLNLKCTLRYYSRQFTMDWDVPNKNGIDSGQIHISKSKKTKNDDEYFQNLEIENTTLADQGEYTCIVRSTFHVNNDTKFIKVYDNMEHFINLIEESGIYNIWTKAGEPSVQWRIDVDAHPIPKLIWYDNKNNEIQTGLKSNENSKYLIKIENGKYAILKINDITIFDRGYYKLKAINDFEEKTIELYLNVTDKPSVDIQMKDFHIIHESSTIICNVAAYPEATINWFHKPCLDRSCNYTKILSDRVDTKNFLQTAYLNITANRTGYILCTANNSLGSDEDSKEFFLADINNGFGIWGLDEGTIELVNEVSQYPVTVGDNLTIYCAASNNNYTNELYWYKQVDDYTNLRLETHNNYKIENSATEFFNKVILSIPNVSYEDSGKYLCKAEENSIRRTTVTHTVLIAVQESKVFQCPVAVEDD